MSIASLVRRAPGRRPGLTVALLIGGLTALRLAALFSTPLELYPDEAQYWLWAQTPAFGYFSKPPLIAWLIAATTALGGDAEPWVRLSAPLLQGAAALVLFQVGRRLGGVAAGGWAAAVYSLMPGVQLSSGVIATDAPLLFFLSLALWAYAELWAGDEVPADNTRGQARRWLALTLGLTLGFACLSKYAAVYMAAGLGLHAMLDARARRMWTPARLGWATLALAGVLAPNLFWNAAHGLATFRHTISDANLGGERSAGGWLHAGSALAFVAGQFVVFGPLPFAILLFAAGKRARNRGADRLLLCLAAPALAVVLGEALLARANANWAASAYVPGSVLVGLWLARLRGEPRWAWLRPTVLALQGGLAAAFLVLAVRPELADGAGLGNALKRARGWEALERSMEREVRTAQAQGPLAAVAVDDRFVFNALAYYGREFWRAPGAPPLRMWVRYGRPLNQAEAEAPLAGGAGAGGRVLFLNLIADYRAETRADFAHVSDERRVSVRLDPRRVRTLTVFTGVGFRPGPRDAAGRPLAR